MEAATANRTRRVETDKRTIEAYVKAGLWKDLGTPKWAGQYKAEIPARASVKVRRGQSPQFMDVILVVPGYFPPSFTAPTN